MCPKKSVKSARPSVNHHRRTKLGSSFPVTVTIKTILGQNNWLKVGNVGELCFVFVFWCSSHSQAVVANVVTYWNNSSEGIFFVILRWNFSLNIKNLIATKIFDGELFFLRIQQLLLLRPRQGAMCNQIFHQFMISF